MKNFKNHSIRRRLSLILISSTITAVLLSAIFVNIAMNATFSKYMNDVQSQRNERIVEYFQQIYVKDGRLNQNSGEELMHEAYMSNYCLTLLDESKNVIWGMNPSDIKSDLSIHTGMGTDFGKGVYTSKTFDITVNGKIVGYVDIGQYYPVLLTEQDINFKNSINQGIIYSVIYTIAITAVLSLVISKQFSRPIKKASDMSVALSKGNYGFRSDVKSSISEINNLIESTNMLGEKLSSQDLLRKRLVSDMSHEIRTPLNVLQNNIEAMIDGVLPVTEERLNSLNDEVIRFGKLLSNLNSLNQFEVEDIEYHFQTLSLDKLLEDVCMDFKPFAREKNVDLIYKQANDERYIEGDEDKLKQVFINLLSNAVKFNKNDGSVWVSLKENKDKLIVEIMDNGKGINRDDLPYIFERLYRGDKSRHQTTGSGIGLTIVKKILRMHSASVDVESEVNKGSTFKVSFDKVIAS
jgi:signal transduction histidine kinase